MTRIETVETERTVYDVGDLQNALDVVVNQAGADYRYLDHYTECENFAFTDVEKANGNDLPGDTPPPACIVGRVLAYLGFNYSECKNDGGIASTARNIQRVRPNVRFTPAFLLAAAAAQGAQDDGGTFGMARSAAAAVIGVTGYLGIEH